MNSWDNWTHSKDEEGKYFLNLERSKQIFDFVDEIVKDWFAVEARYYFNHHTKSYVERHAERAIKDLNEDELRLISRIVENHLPNKIHKMPLGWLFEKFRINLFVKPSNDSLTSIYYERIVENLHNEDKVIEMNSIWDIKKTDKLEGDRNNEWFFSNVETDTCPQLIAFEEVKKRLHELKKEDIDNQEIYDDYLLRIKNVEEKTRDSVLEKKLKYRKRLNNQGHCESLNKNGKRGYLFSYLDEEVRKIVRHFLIHANHSNHPIVIRSNNAIYTIRYQGEKRVGKSAFRYEEVKERKFLIDIETSKRKVEDILVRVIPEKVVGSNAISESNPGEVFAVKVFHPKYKKWVGVRKGNYSGNYHLYVDYPKVEGEEGFKVYKHPELFQEKDSDTVNKTTKIFLELIAEYHKSNMKK